MQNVDEIRGSNTVEINSTVSNESNHSAHNDGRVLLRSSSALPPKGISQAVWEKFQSLQKRREELTRKSTDKRIKAIQQETIERVRAECHTSDELEAMNLPSTDVASGKCSGKIKVQKEDKANATEEQWKKLGGYMSVNEHLKGHTGRDEPKRLLEKHIDDAVALGEFEIAEKLSDRLATRDFGVKITEAIDARNFAEKRKREKEGLVKRNKKLAWGFEQKQRWETKSNM